MLHVTITTDTSMTWCNQKLNELSYANAEAAALNGRFDKKKNLCGLCIDAITEALENGRVD